MVPSPPGLPCPRCGFHIATSLELLLAQRPFFCAACGLKLTLNVDQSQGALERLRELKDGLDAAENLRRSGPG
ncbi:hypothetical protein SAMN05660860_02648 [Geoalkalibacter ferrihydriticus]|uniref:Uncharacterized protein n=2 Tax=Geoalkalibacter ferrihydriticus TaxID=392333 RepID=A0A0C2EBT4_9BACT|nr:hypothetical protein [Geoalkalibacter ferrihydriticus]KIH76033.1 hypothetical protein GFER_12265 [Geoalkalibacter ferrihydriticus DSM 17813]SDM48838.1 hypothetical protein SAMN05660860_02648 [Geoalkalibacter ferrihydriticus]